MFSFDVDGPTNWINRHATVWSSPRTFSMGSYGPWRGLPRILDALDERDIRATFFVPGWVAETWPERFTEIDGRGHEIGHHGYLHESYFDRDLDEQRAIIDRSQKIFEDLTGKTARGFRTPSGDFRRESPALLSELGFSYSSSMRGDDRPYRWMIDGELSDLIEIPAQWQLDDFPQFGFNLTPALPTGQDRIAPHESTFENWRYEFDGYYRYGLCFVIMFHPQVIGKPGRLAMLGEFIDYIKRFDDVWITTGSEIADWWRSQEGTEP